MDRDPLDDITAGNSFTDRKVYERTMMDRARDDYRRAAEERKQNAASERRMKIEVTVESCMEKYGQRNELLKSALVDMFDELLPQEKS